MFAIPLVLIVAGIGVAIWNRRKQSEELKQDQEERAKTYLIGCDYEVNNCGKCGEKLDKEVVQSSTFSEYDGEQLHYIKRVCRSCGKDSHSRTFLLTDTIQRLQNSREENYGFAMILIVCGMVAWAFIYGC